MATLYLSNSYKIPDQLAEMELYIETVDDTMELKIEIAVVKDQCWAIVWHRQTSEA